jgi:hypothetical protein
MRSQNAKTSSPVRSSFDRMLEGIRLVLTPEEL